MGANLQCYALVKFLKALGHNVYVIQHRGETVSFKDEELRAAAFPYYKPGKIKYAAFATKHFNLTPIVVAQRFKRPLAKLKLDAVICGSDQIWSKDIVNFNRTFFGGDFNGDSDENRVMLASYAASLGTSDLTDEAQKQNFQYLLRGFDYVSVRERAQSDLLADAIGMPVTVCCDPTFLLNASDYEPIVAERPYAGQYVYEHYYYNKNLKHLHAFTLNLLCATGFPLVVNVSTPQHKFDETVVDGTNNWAAEEALAAIYHAEFVTTSSFHAVAFSIIFRKRFWYVLKGDATDTRVTDLLRTLGLDGRIIDGNRPLPGDWTQAPDWARVSAKLWELRKSSIDYLMRVTANGKRKERLADYLTSGDEFACYGCAACKDACPTKAIDTVTNAEGFPFPQTDRARCTDCGLCHKVCPYNTKPRCDDYDPHAYLAFSNDDDIRVNSSSGGMYQTFANAILEKGGAVVGVRWGDGEISRRAAQYDIAETKKQSEAFRYSKYVFPAHNDIYVKTKKALDGGKPVLFTGSPCKIAGLKNYLRKDYDNLYTCEIICHGAPSPLVLKMGLEAKEKEHNSKLTFFTQRSTKASGKSQSSEYVFENGESELVPLRKDLLLLLLVQHVSLRKSCNQCEFCKENLLSDITIGDFWGSEKFYDGDVYKGVSCLIVNTPKGAALLDEVRDTLYLQEQTVADVYAGNHSAPSKMHRNRGMLFTRLQEPNADTDAVFKQALGRGQTDAG
jgi:coenzyme F420-reducing hydrogenase beta subunit